MNHTCSVSINKPIAHVWKLWTEPSHIVCWNFAHESWCCPSATNDLVIGGKFSYRMEAKDKSFGFDFSGVYEFIELNRRIIYALDDQRKVEITFIEADGVTTINEVFESENQHSGEVQRQGWQAILDNFKQYAESEVFSEVALGTLLK